MKPIIIYQNNSGYIPLIGLTDNSFNPPQYVDNATVITATLYDPNNNPVSGLTGVAGVYVTGSNGNYNFPVPSTFAPAIVPGQYTLQVTVQAPSGSTANWYIPASIQVRGQAAYST
jgi:hypothetical protein